MQARINNTPLLLVFLDSVGTQSRFADAVRVRDWYERMPSGAQPIRRLMLMLGGWVCAFWFVTHAFRNL